MDRRKSILGIAKRFHDGAHAAQIKIHAASPQSVDDF
jgi:hypothetical protein